MLPSEHSAILRTFVKLPFVLKIFVMSIFEWSFYTGFTVCHKLGLTLLCKYFLIDNSCLGQPSPLLQNLGPVSSSYLCPWNVLNHVKNNVNSTNLGQRYALNALMKLRPDPVIRSGLMSELLFSHDTPIIS